VPKPVAVGAVLLDVIAAVVAGAAGRVGAEVVLGALNRLGAA